MAHNRHLGRIIVLQTIFEYTFRKESNDPDVNLDAILNSNIERYEKTLGDKDFVKNLTEGVIEKAKELDEKIQPLAPEWPLAQIPAVDHIILQIATYELLYMGEIIPPKVAINESVELAKEFGTDKTSKFVNGVLGSLFRQVQEENNDGEEKPATQVVD